MPTRAYVEKRNGKVILYCFVNEMPRVMHRFHINTSHINIHKWAKRNHYDVMNMRDLRYT